MANWRNGARCHPIVMGGGADLWFSEDDEERNEAKAICSGCPVRYACLNYAMVNQEEFGIFGGLDEEDRNAFYDTWSHELGTDGLDALHQIYAVVPQEDPTSSVEWHAPTAAKYKRRLERAREAFERLINSDPHEIPHYDMYFEVLEAVLAHPVATGDELGASMGRTGALFNIRLREAFKQFDVDLTVL